MATVGIKLSDNNFSASCAKVIRKYKNISISEVKDAVVNNDYLFSCDYIDEEGIKIVLKINKELNENGLSCKLFEHDVPTTVEFLSNLVSTYEGINEEVEEVMNNEALASEGN